MHYLLFYLYIHLALIIDYNYHNFFIISILLMFLFPLFLMVCLLFHLLFSAPLTNLSHILNYIVFTYFFCTFLYIYFLYYLFLSIFFFFTAKHFVFIVSCIMNSPLFFHLFIHSLILFSLFLISSIYYIVISFLFIFFSYTLYVFH